MMQDHLQEFLHLHLDPIEESVQILISLKSVLFHQDQDHPNKDWLNFIYFVIHLLCIL